MNDEALLCREKKPTFQQIKTPFEDRSYHEIFPYDTYRDKQEEIIENIKDSIKNKDGCIIVARNGIGKTVLALTAVMSIKSNGILILSRTHRQMSHFVEEINNIRNTRNFDVSYIELLSRSSYCINLAVNKLDKDLIDIGCYKNCKRYEESEICKYTIFGDDVAIDITRDTSGSDINYGDMKTIREYGIRNKICPYYLSRAYAQKHPLIVGTYMYIDKDIRTALGISIDGKIIIFDEAHNILSFLEEKQKRVIDLPLVKELSQSRSITKGIRVFLNRVIRFINKIQNDSGNTEHRKLSYKEFENYLTEYNITRELLISISIQLQDLTRNLSNYDLVYNISRVVSFFELFYQIDDIAFIGYVNTLKENGKKVTKLGVQSLDIAPIIRELVESGAKLIFMSGTLNIDMFEFRLKLNELQFNSYEYLIENRRIQTYIVSKSENNLKLTSSYYARNGEVFEEYGETIQHLMENVPEGNIVFFPSYDYKKNALESWKLADIVVEENDHYYFKLGVVNENGEEIKIRLFDDITDPNEDVIEEFKEYVKTNRAVLCSVYRSRGSEGEDYTNIKGIYIIGIPFANIKDAGVILKKKYYNTLRRGYGDAWYNSDAIDAVNQACGRGIRKERDYCALFLMDNRYAVGTYFNYMSGWIREGLVKDISLRNHIPSKIAPILRRFYAVNKKINRMRKLE
jgi:Rad3-related DNA helicase